MFWYVVDGMMGCVMCEYVLLMFWMFGMIKFYKYNLLVFDDEVILEYFVENIFVVGLV